MKKSILCVVVCVLLYFSNDVCMDNHARWQQKQFESWLNERLQKEVPVEAQHLEGMPLALKLMQKILEEEERLRIVWLEENEKMAQKRERK